MREKIGIVMIGLLLLFGTIAVVPANATTTESTSTAVDSVVSLAGQEDRVYQLDLTTIFEEGWASIDVEQTNHLDVQIDGNVANITPQPDWNGNESFLMTATYYSVSPPPDNSIRSVETYTVQVNMHISPVNDPPYIKGSAPSYFRVYGDSVTSIDLYKIFGDVDNPSLTFEVSSSTSDIMTSLTDEELQLRSVAGYYGINTLNMSASDGEYTTAYHLTIYATPDHDITLDEDGMMIVPVGDYLPAGWYSIEASATDGIITHLNGEGAVMVTTEKDWNGNGTVEITAQYYSDSPPDDHITKGNSIITLDIPTHVIPVNDPPYIKQSINWVVTFNEDTSLTANLYDYFGDVDSDTLQFGATASNPAVSLEIKSDGTMTLTPAANWDGTFTVDVSASDGQYTTEMPVSLRVAPTPDIYMSEDGIGTVYLPHYFKEGWASMRAETDSDISVTIDDETAHILPSANWNGEENITFTATYIGGVQPFAAPSYYTVSKVADIRVAPVNDAPFVKACFPSYVEMSEDEVLTANLYDYFGDIDSSELQFTATSTGGHVSFDIDHNGNIVIEPEANWSGYTDIIVTAFDGELATSAAATMAVSPSPDIRMEEDTEWVINVSDYFKPGWVSISVTSNGENISTVVDQSAGLIRIDPSLNWNGYATLEISALYPNYIIYGVEPKAAPGYTTMSKKADIVVEPVNDPPVQIKALPPLSTAEDEPMSLNLNEYFTDVDSPLSFDINTGTGVNAHFDQSTGMLTITPDENWNGNTDLQISVSDGQYGISSEKTLTVRPINDAPVQIAPLPEFQMDEDGTMTVDLNDYFIDVDSPLTFHAEPDGPFNVTINESGVATIIPNANWNGETALNITVSDGEFALEKTALLEVAPVNDPPVILADIPELEFSEDGTAFLNLDNYFKDIDSPITFSVRTGDGLKAMVSPINHLLRVTTEPDWNGNSNIEVRASDGEFLLSESSSVRVRPIDDAPTVLKNLKMICGMEDSVLTLDLDDYFHDVDSQLTYTWSAPECFNITMDPQSHVVTIVPTSNWYGVSELTFTASDGTYSKSITPTLNIKGVEDAPMLLREREVFNAVGGQTIKIDLSSLFSDPDSDELTYTVAGEDGNSIPFVVDKNSHTLTITVPAHAKGTFEFTVTASDGNESASTEIYALVMPLAEEGGGGTTEAAVNPAMSDAAVMAIALISSAALVGMLVYHAYQYRKYEDRKKETVL